MLGSNSSYSKRHERTISGVEDFVAYRDNKKAKSKENNESISSDNEDHHNFIYNDDNDANNYLNYDDISSFNADAVLYDGDYCEDGVANSEDGYYDEEDHIEADDDQDDNKNIDDNEFEPLIGDNYYRSIDSESEDVSDDDDVRSINRSLDKTILDYDINQNVDNDILKFLKDYENDDNNDEVDVASNTKIFNESSYSCKELLAEFDNIYAIEKVNKSTENSFRNALKKYIPRLDTVNNSEYTKDDLMFTFQFEYCRNGCMVFEGIE